MKSSSEDALVCLHDACCLHSEACNALGASDGVIHSRISSEAVSLRATANTLAQVRWSRLLVYAVGVTQTSHLRYVRDAAQESTFVHAPPQIRLLARQRCASQRSLQDAPIFRLLLKVAVKGTHQCDFLNFCGCFAHPTNI